MPNTYENQVRREQLNLLRFEKFLRSIAPVALATGLTITGVQEAQAHRATLDNAKVVFANMDSNRGTSDVITTSVARMGELIFQLSHSTPLHIRQKAMLELMEVVDYAHQTAQDSSHRHGVRLIGERIRGGQVDGGTPKVSKNAEWLRRTLVDGGTPKVSNNLGWLKSTFGF